MIEFYESRSSSLAVVVCSNLKIGSLAKLLVNSILPPLWCKKVASLAFFMVAMKTESYMHRIHYAKAVDTQSKDIFPFLSLKEITKISIWYTGHKEDVVRCEPRSSLDDVRHYERV